MLITKKKKKELVSNIRGIFVALVVFFVHGLKFVDFFNSFYVYEHLFSKFM